MDEDKRSNKGYYDDDDGVVYTPSKNRPEVLDETRRVDVQGVVRRDIKKAGDSNLNKNRTSAKKHKSQFAIFFITTIFAFALILVISFALVFNSLVKSKESSASNSKTNKTELDKTVNESTETVPVEETKTVNAIITNVAGTSKSLTLLDLDDNKVYNVYIDNTTELKNKFGKPMVFAEFKVGDIVEASLGKADSLLTRLKSSTSSWSFENYTGVEVNAETKEIKFGSSTYKYSDSIIALYKGEAYDISKVDSSDIVNLVGYQDNVYFVDVQKGHGTITVTKRDDIKNAMIEVDTTIAVALDETMEIKVQEGARRVVIKGDNIDPVTKEIVIEKDTNFVLDLSDIALKAGVMKFKINEADAKLFINNEEKDFNEPIVLEYGEYNLKVMKEGFASWEQQIVFNTPEKEINVNLEKKLQVSSITINTNPKEAEIYIDNVYIGVTPVTAKVEYGMRTVMVKKEGYIDVSFPIDVSRENYPLTLTLQQKAMNLPKPDDAVPVEQIPVDSTLINPTPTPEGDSGTNSNIIPPDQVSSNPPGTVVGE